MANQRQKEKKKRQVEKLERMERDINVQNKFKLCLSEMTEICALTLEEVG